MKASDIRDAVSAEKGGSDAVIVKGWEGGGHTTYEATTVLVPQAANKISLPLIASGGIADGRDMAAAISLGADGIEMGTVFMAASESVVHPNVRRSVLEAEDMSTVITGTCTAEPCRQLKNALSDEMDAIEADNIRQVAAEKLRTIAEKSLKLAMLEGDMDRGAVMAGQIVSLINQEETVAQIIVRVIAECKITFTEIQKYEFS